MTVCPPLRVCPSGERKERGSEYDCDGCVGVWGEDVYGATMCTWVRTDAMVSVRGGGVCGYIRVYATESGLQERMGEGQTRAAGMRGRGHGRCFR